MRLLVCFLILRSAVGKGDARRCEGQCFVSVCSLSSQCLVQIPEYHPCSDVGLPVVEPNEFFSAGAEVLANQLFH